MRIEGRGKLPEAPPAPEWRTSNVAQAIGTNVAFEHGAVQFIGRTPIGIEDVVLQVGIQQLLALVGSIVSMMDQRNPHYLAIRASLLPDPAQLSLLAPPGS